MARQNQLITGNPCSFVGLRKRILSGTVGVRLNVGNVAGCLQVWQSNPEQR